MASNKKSIEIKNLTDELIYKPSTIESELEKRLKKLGHPLRRPNLVTEGYDDGVSFSGRGFFFYLLRDTAVWDKKGTKIIYRKGAWRNYRTYEDLVKGEIEKSKNESIKLVGNKGILAIDFRFISNNLAEIINHASYECVKYFKEAYTGYSSGENLESKKKHLPEIKLDLESKNTSDILNFIIYSTKLTSMRGKYR